VPLNQQLKYRGYTRHARALADTLVGEFGEEAIDVQLKMVNKKWKLTSVASV
jgi:hypothetical protein